MTKKEISYLDSQAYRKIARRATQLEGFCEIMMRKMRMRTVFAKQNLKLRVTISESNTEFVSRLAISQVEQNLNKKK